MLKNHTKFNLKYGALSYKGQIIKHIQKMVRYHKENNHKTSNFPVITNAPFEIDVECRLLWIIKTV